MILRLTAAEMVSIVSTTAIVIIKTALAAGKFLNEVGKLVLSQLLPLRSSLELRTLLH